MCAAPFAASRRASCHAARRRSTARPKQRTRLPNSCLRGLVEMAKIGIVGHEAAKFTDQTKAQALAIIRDLLAPPGTVVVSGRCPLGGVDVWAEEIAAELGREPLIYPPKANAWETGFKPRNIQIAEASDELHC